MKLKGNMVIEMIDDATGEVVERVQEENMVTNAVNHILGLNPMGIFYSVAGEYDTHLLWNDNLIPICPNMIGGILLYSEALTADADNIYPSTNKLPVAYASNDVNATADVARGSMNLTESKPLDNGYRFVWEFTPSQGNGTIAAVALTSKQGGVAAYGSMENSKAAFYQIMETRLETQTVEELAELFSAVEVDFENNILISMRFQDSSVIIHKRRLPVFTLGLNDRLNDTTNDLLEEKVIPCSTFKFIGSYTPYGDFLDGHDGYWYGFANQANSSGDAKMYWVKIKKDDYTMSGNKISVKTLDLSGDFARIEEQLYRIAKDYFGDTVDTHFYMKGRGCDGIGVRSGKSGFMLLAGSCVSQKSASSTCPEHILRLREEYSNKIQNAVLTENVIFHSASAAASFLMMANVNGNLAWKTKEGTCLGEYRKKY